MTSQMPHGESAGLAGAATASPSAARTQHLLALMKHGDDGFNRRDPDNFHAVHHPNMGAHIMGSVAPIRGRDALAAALAGMIAAFPDVHVENDPYPIQFGEGDWITVISKNTGTFTGELRLPNGTVIPGTGKPFSVDFTTTARWEGDLMVEEWVFWDSALLNQQIGLG